LLLPIPLLLLLASPGAGLLLLLSLLAAALLLPLLLSRELLPPLLLLPLLLLSSTGGTTPIPAIWFQLRGALNCPVTLFPRSNADTLLALSVLLASFATHQKQLPGLHPQETASWNASPIDATTGLLCVSVFFTMSSALTITGSEAAAAFAHLLEMDSNASSILS
jgi:hypothetical protein